MGDGFLTLPFLYEFHDQFPQVKISVLASKYNYRLFEPLDFLEEVLIYRQDPKELYRKLADRHYDLFFNPKDHPSLTLLRMMKHIHAGCKIGLEHPQHNKHYNFLLENNESMPVIEKNGLLLNLYGGKVALKNEVPIIDHLEADFWKNLPSESLFGHMCINLSSGGSLRKLQTAKWIEIINYIFQNKLSFKINLLAMPENHADAMIIKSKFLNKINYPIPTKNIYEAGIVIKNSCLFISPDTALVHVAAAVKTPVIGLYQNKGLNLNRFSPYGVDCEIVLSPDREIGNIQTTQIIKALENLCHENNIHQ